MNNLGDILLSMIYFYFIFMVIWIFIQVFADIFRRNDLSGGMKVVWIAVIFIVPFLGAMAYILMRPKMTEQDQQLMAEAKAQQDRVTGYSSADEVAKLVVLRDSGAITPAEFEAQKAKALA